MPISVQNIDDTYTILLCKGEVNVDDFVKANDRIYSNVGENVARYQIVDLRDVTRLLISTEDIQTIAAQDKNAVKSLKQIAIAVVATKDLDFGLARMWEAYASTTGIETHVFRDMVAAQDWILSMRNKETRP